MNAGLAAGKRLDGKVAIVTGATGGIGEATAKLFIAEGARVMLVARSAEKLAATRGRLNTDDAVAEYVADATDEEATAKAVAATVKAFDGVDILFANAGTEGKLKPLEEQSFADFKHVLRTNVTGVWLSMKYCVEPMKKRGGGSMIAVASIAGAIGFPQASPYVASKHAVRGLVKSAALELAGRGIRVNAISPGLIDNRMMRSVEAQLSPDDAQGMYETLKGLVAMKRYGTNEEVARIALFLASDESSYCTGTTFFVDGGFTAA
jgi:NAD(P)-dependent dehydrogenase (short-subunit alcohol dehydrogenase family)